jgi:hypothetical protein
MASFFGSLFINDRNIPGAAENWAIIYQPFLGPL